MLLGLLSVFSIETGLLFLLLDFEVLFHFDNDEPLAITLVQNAFFVLLDLSIVYDLCMCGDSKEIYS